MSFLLYVMVVALVNDLQLQNITPDGRLKSPKHVDHLMINKDSLLEFVHLVGLLIYTLQCDVQCVQCQTD